MSTIIPFLSELRPKTFVIENVPGLRRDSRLKDLVGKAERLGYAVRMYVVDAADFGVPQTRRRLVAIAIRSDAIVPFPEHLAELLPRSFRRTPPPIAEVLTKAGPIEGTRDPVHRARTNSPTVAERIRSIPVNGDRFDLPQDQQLECHKALNGRRNATFERDVAQVIAFANLPSPLYTSQCEST